MRIPFSASGRAPVSLRTGNVRPVPDHHVESRWGSIMHQTVGAIVDGQGNVRSFGSVSVSAGRRVLVSILDDEAPAGQAETALLSERALAGDWNRPEEDVAWSHLQRVESS